jgi:hypothetical protein
MLVGLVFISASRFARSVDAERCVQANESEQVLNIFFPVYGGCRKRETPKKRDTEKVGHRENIVSFDRALTGPRASDVFRILSVNLLVLALCLPIFAVRRWVRVIYFPYGYLL